MRGGTSSSGSNVLPRRTSSVDRFLGDLWSTSSELRRGGGRNTQPATSGTRSPFADGVAGIGKGTGRSTPLYAGERSEPVNCLK